MGSVLLVREGQRNDRQVGPGKESAGRPLPLQTLTHQSRCSPPFPLLHPVQLPSRPNFSWKLLPLRASETGEDRKETPPLSPARRSWGLCWRGVDDVDGHWEEHSFPREESPNLQALLKDSPTQPGVGVGGLHLHPFPKLSLSRFINRKYSISWREGGRGAVWKRELAPPSGRGSPAASFFSLSFIVSSSSRCWGLGESPS